MKKSIFIFMIGAFFINACQSDEVLPAEEDNIQEQEIEMLVEALSREFTTTSIEGGDEHQPFGVRNFGLSDAFSTNDEDMPARRPGPPSNAGNNDNAGNKFVACLVRVSNNHPGQANIRQAFMEYNRCKADQVQRFREAVMALNGNMEEARKALVEQFRAEEITREEFAEALNSLRERYQAAIRELTGRNQARFNQCLRAFLSFLNENLSEEEWKQFRTCVSN